MKVAIEVKDRSEAAALKRGMDDPATKALCLMMGTLLALPTDKARRRALAYVQDRLDEEAGKPAACDTNGG